jgi:hypothetical protein
MEPEDGRPDSSIMASQKKSPTVYESDLLEEAASTADFDAYAMLRELVASEPTTFPRIGDFFADYSYLSLDEIAETDLDSVELFEHSRPISRADETDLECRELFENSKPVSR